MRGMKQILGGMLIPIVGTLSIGCAGVGVSHLPHQIPTPNTALYGVRLADEIVWEQLNPARGDQSPKAGTLWGQRLGPGAAGFLLNPADGFRSPPHIHNVAYRGIVISDYLHNDDPNAADMWMGVGSFWTQPAGEIHITAAKGSNALAYIEVEDSFGVFPPDSFYESGEKPVNVDATNLVWLDSSVHGGICEGAEVAVLWGKPSASATYGFLLKLRAGFTGRIESESDSLRGVVISGQASYSNPSSTEEITVDPGSLFYSEGASRHRLSISDTGEALIYIRTDGPFRIVE